MTSEGHRAAAKSLGDVANGDLREVLANIMSPEEVKALAGHLMAIHTGTLLRLVEIVLQRRFEDPEDRFFVVLSYLKQHPDYVPTGILPQTPSEGLDPQKGNDADDAARAAFKYELQTRLRLQFPSLERDLGDHRLHGILEPLLKYLETPAP